MMKLMQHNCFGTYKSDIALDMKLRMVRRLQTTCEFTSDKGRISFI